MWSFFSRDSSKDFAFELGDLVEGFKSKSIFSLYKARKKGTNEAVSIFSYDIKNGSEDELEIARAALKRLKTLRHPSILQYLDSVENDKYLYIATEYVEPLAFDIPDLELTGIQKELYQAWGIFQITVSTLIYFEFLQIVSLNFFLESTLIPYQ